MHLEDMPLYKASIDLASAIYDAVTPWPFFDKDTLGKQIVRSADSVPSNIAEGYGRFGVGDHRRFLLYARGSIFELRVQLELASRRRLIPPEKAETLRAEVQSVLAQLTAYFRSIPYSKT